LQSTALVVINAFSRLLKRGFSATLRRRPGTDPLAAVAVIHSALRAVAVA
jgi:hypothetical protein